MKYNWKPSKVAFLDFETQSQCELTTVHKYASHPSTRALTCVIKAEDQVFRFGPYLTPTDKHVMAEIAKAYTLVAHNAPFDSAIWERTEGLPPCEWFDTLPCARAAGLPGGLDRLSLAIGGRGKDKNGKRLVDMLCILRSDKIPAVGPAHKLLMDYNVQDVEELELVYGRVKGYGEPDVMDVDYVINQRGVPINRKFLHQLIDLYETNSVKLKAAFDETTDGVNPNSPKQVQEWLASKGYPVPSVGKTVFKDLMSKPEEFYQGDEDESGAAAAFDVVRQAMEQRREIVRVGRGKADAALEALEDDDRIREQFVYYGAGPGRWSGRGLQLHNMPQAAKHVDAKGLEPTYAAVCEAAEEATKRAADAGDEAKVGVADVLNAMLRHIVTADNLLIADYSAVEARCAAWLADCDKMLAMYADPTKSLYLDMGRQVFGRVIAKTDKAEYALSKALILGCQYGMGGAKFEMLCMSRNMSVATLASVGLKAADAVKVYRAAYPELPRAWRACNSAVHEAVTNRNENACCKCIFTMVGPDLHIVLPSKRPIVYRNARIEMRVPGYCALYGMPPTPVATIVYDSARFHTSFLYGSKIFENICQAVCRDILATKLVHLEHAGFRTILHVHDEAGAADSQSRFAEFLELLTAPLPWSTGFPILSEGYSGPVWTKQPKGYKELSALDGKLL